MLRMLVDIGRSLILLLIIFSLCTNPLFDFIALGDCAENLPPKMRFCTAWGGWFYLIPDAKGGIFGAWSLDWSRRAWRWQILKLVHGNRIFFGGATIHVTGTNLLFFLGSIACFQKEYSLKIRVPFLGLNFGFWISKSIWGSPMRLSRMGYTR